MGDRTHVTELRVRYAETDQMGVVYHANYLIWCEAGRTEYIRAAGTPYAQIERDGVALAVVDVTMRCHAPARYDEMIRVETSLTEVKSRTLTFDYVIKRAETGERLVSARTVLASIDSQGRITTFPSAVRERLERA
ncbi:MAG: acyl-CoA thioesterase [Gemmatimonadales bacterium]|jgi:acyl-CoA thioester hydrolase